MIDTIGQNNKSFVDAYRTPHTDQIHVTERWTLSADAKYINVIVHVEDPGAFAARRGRPSSAGAASKMRRSFRCRATRTTAISSTTTSCRWLKPRRRTSDFAREATMSKFITQCATAGAFAALAIAALTVPASSQGFGAQTSPPDFRRQWLDQ